MRLLRLLDGTFFGATVLGALTTETEIDVNKLNNYPAQVGAIVVDAHKRTTVAHRWEILWGTAHTWLGGFSAVTGVIAASFAFHSTAGRVPAAVLALIAAGLAALAAFLRSDSRLANAKKRLAAWSEVETDALFILPRLPQSGDLNQELEVQLKALSAKRIEAMKLD